jgi:CTP:molybdopterin cytidylyltransferase MocA
MRESFVGLLLGGLPWRRLHVDLEALPFGTETVLGRTLRAYKEAGASRIVLATGPRTEALEAAIAPYREALEWVEAAEAETTLAPAIAAGARALGNTEHPIALGFADMPLLNAELLTGLARAFREAHKPIGVPLCQEQLGHPVFFLPELRGDLVRLSGTATHRNIVFARGDDVAVLETPQSAVLRTIEGASEYREMLGIARLPLTAESRF